MSTEDSGGIGAMIAETAIPVVVDIVESAVKAIGKTYGVIHKKTEAEINGKKGFLIWDYIIFNEITFKSEDGEIESFYLSRSDEKTEKVWNDLVRKYGVLRPVPSISETNLQDETLSPEKININIPEGNTVMSDNRENEKLNWTREIADRFAELIKSAARTYGVIHEKARAELDGKEGFLIWDYILFNEITFLSDDGEIKSLFISGSDKKTREAWNDLVRKYGA